MGGPSNSSLAISFILRPATIRWVIGDDPYVSLHLMGVDHYAALERPKGKR
jgi:hypothetical protein